MNINITGRHVDLTDALRQFTNEKFNKIICEWIFSSNVKIKFKNEFKKAITGSNLFWDDLDKESLSKHYEILN